MNILSIIGLGKDARELLCRARAAAKREVDRHLAEGRSVTGRDAVTGKPIRIDPPRRRAEDEPS